MITEKAIEAQMERLSKIKEKNREDCLTAMKLDGINTTSAVAKMVGLTTTTTRKYVKDILANEPDSLVIRLISLIRSRQKPKRKSKRNGIPASKTMKAIRIPRLHLL